MLGVISRCNNGHVIDVVYKVFFFFYTDVSLDSKDYKKLNEFFLSVTTCQCILD